jgi:hypothetical protein
LRVPGAGPARVAIVAADSAERAGSASPRMEIFGESGAAVRILMLFAAAIRCMQ